VPLEMTEGNYSNVGHRGPVYKGLGAMNPCENLHIYWFRRQCPNSVAPMDVGTISRAATDKR
jgi:hypothetical protein